jgi:hypothetical protein
MNDKNHIVLPLGEYRLLSIKGVGRIFIYVFDILQPLLFISATTQKKAYTLGNNFRSVINILCNLPIDTEEFGLFESDVKPKDIFDRESLLKSIKREDFCQIELANLVFSGLKLDPYYFDYIIKTLKKVINNPHLSDALLHLEHSCDLRGGLLRYGRYEEYCSERKFLNQYVLERRYYENRVKFDLAIVSTFRGIEALLGTVSINRHNIVSLIKAIESKYNVNFSNIKYESKHLFFSVKRKMWSFVDIILEFKIIRDAVSAHGNIQPPVRICQDHVYEIQHLLFRMLSEILIKKR